MKAQRCIKDPILNVPLMLISVAFLSTKVIKIPKESIMTDYFSISYI